MRSYSGCSTCRKRKLKCDEVKPQCGHCRLRSSCCVFQERKVFRVSGSFEDDHVWLETPPQLIFIRIENPYDDEWLSVSGTDQAATCSLPPAIRQLDHTQYKQHVVPTQAQPTAIVGDLDDDSRDKVLVSRMLRHFSAGPGQWMDVFDTGAYFAHKVPVLATSSPLLKSAVCALSAKHLHHLQSIASSQVHKPPSSALQMSRSLDVPNHDDNTVDWKYQSAKHYDLAINALKTEIEQREFDTDEEKREEVLAAIAVLCAGELMDEPGEAWRAHLSVLPLFSNQPESAMKYLAAPVSVRPDAVSGPIFWSLSRQDLLCAFLSERRTRLDLGDVSLWHKAGLNVDANGRLLPTDSHPYGEDRPAKHIATTEQDTRSNEIHWLLGKIANFIASGDTTQESLLKIWSGLAQQLQQWHQSLPESFLCTARTTLAHHSECLETSHLARFEQVWHQVPICAAAMQSYHLASILLLVNRPQKAATTIRSSVSERLTAYRNSEREALRHAREMCGISLAGPTDANRVHSVQPLSAAGQVFEDERDRRVVIELLEGIERDLGWRTGHHVERLKALSAQPRGEGLFVI